MPTFRHGKSAVFKITDSGATLRDISNAANEVSMPRSIETGETTAFGATAKSYVTGLSDSTLSVSGTYDATVDGYLAGLVGSDATAWEYGPEGSTASRIKFTGNAILTSYEVGSPVGDVVTFKAEFQVSGAITRTTW